MTGKDTLWFGKHKGKTLEHMLSMEKGWCSWFLTEDWTKEKYPELFAFLSSGGKVTSTKEVERDNVEDELMADASPGFIEWWRQQYGKGLRASRSELYIPHLRIAKAAWEAALKHEDPLSIDRVKPVMAKPPAPPKPLPKPIEPKPPVLDDPDLF